MQNQIRIFQNNEIIFRENTYEKCMYDIRSGSVNIYLNYGAEDEKLLTVLGAGQFFGEIAVADARPRTATAVAAQDGTELCVITAETFKAYFYEEPGKLLAIMRHMSSRLRSLTHDYLEARQVLSEASGAAKNGVKQNDGLRAKLAKLVQAAVRPAFLKPAVRYNEGEFMSAKEEQAYVLKSFGNNEVIFREGDASGCMYDIQYGSVGIYADYDKDSRKLLARLNPGEYFGEMGILEGLPRSATAVALEAKTTLQLISEARFGVYLSENPLKIIAIMSHLSSRISDLTREYMHICKLAEKAGSDGDAQNGSWLDRFLDICVDAYSTTVDPSDFYGRYCR